MQTFSFLRSFGHNVVHFCMFLHVFGCFCSSLNGIELSSSEMCRSFCNSYSVVNGSHFSGNGSHSVGKESYCVGEGESLCEEGEGESLCEEGGESHSVGRVSHYVQARAVCEGAAEGLLQTRRAGAGGS